jgi:glycyl-tRNA synthetase beta chain
MTAKNLLVELFVEELPPKALKKLGEAFAAALANAEKGRPDRRQRRCDRLRFAAPPGRACDRRARRGRRQAGGAEADAGGRGLDASGNATPALLKKLAALGADASAVPPCAAKTTARPTSCSTTAWPRAPPGRGPAEGARGRAGRAADSQGDELPAAGRLEQRQLRAPGPRLVALHGADVVPVSVLGLNSGRATQGHRFEAAVDPVVIADADSYAETLRATAP